LKLMDYDNAALDDEDFADDKTFDEAVEDA
jgi:hypothetical protein